MSNIETETYITYPITSAEVLDTNHAFIHRLRVTSGPVAVICTLDTDDYDEAQRVAEALDQEEIDCEFNPHSREVPVEAANGRKYYLETFAACVENFAAGTLAEVQEQPEKYRTGRIAINGEIYERATKPNLSGEAEYYE